MRRFAAALLLLSATLTFGQGTKADYERARTLPLVARDTAFNWTIRANWFGNGDRFWFLERSPGAKAFVVVDAARAAKAALFDHERLAESLAKAADQKVDARNLPFDDVTMEAAGMRFSAFGKTWRATLPECTVSALPAEGRPTRSPEGISPNGAMRAFAKDFNLFLWEKAGDATRPLTTDGNEKAAYEMGSWSPDSKRFVAFRVLAGDRLTMPLMESVPREGLRAKVREIEYALPGDKLDQIETWVFDATSGVGIKAEVDPWEPFYWSRPEPTWTASGAFRFRQLCRGYQKKRIWEVAPDGKARAVFEETTDTRFHPGMDYTGFFGNEILYLSNQEGWNHLFRYDAKTGRRLNAITSGSWDVREVVAVDAKAREVLFTAGGHEPGDPYLTHLYRARFDGSGLTDLTPGYGQHEVQRSPNGKWLLDSCSTVDAPTVHTLRRTKDGSAVMEIVRADVARFEALGFRRPIPFAAKGRDGKTDVYGVIYLPSNFSAFASYPVVEYIYAGPRSAHVPKAYRPYDRTLMLAELGFIVVQVDGMGTAWRGKAFHDVSHKNLGDAGLPDHMAWIRAAAEKVPQMDLSRVGIFGYSAGGYDSTRALLAHPEFYKAAVSLCGNHDHRTDKTWWNELWMGYPVGPEYEAQSNVANAAKLEGKLLLIAGEQDDNVPPFSATMRLVDALVKADKSFEMMLLPGRNHNLGGWYVDRRIFDHFVRYLLGVEPRGD
ncbi:MAG: prolyl oligopeptidase family serine peptidase [Fimbriimonadaceae bacterium]|nr:prolyl oligopeptidase family serine peptidase [Fimbriimonadaceae bacterium]